MPLGRTCASLLWDCRMCQSFMLSRYNWSDCVDSQGQEQKQPTYSTKKSVSLLNSICRFCIPSRTHFSTNSGRKSSKKEDTKKGKEVVFFILQSYNSSK